MNVHSTWDTDSAWNTQADPLRRSSRKPRSTKSAEVAVADDGSATADACRRSLLSIEPTTHRLLRRSRRPLARAGEGGAARRRRLPEGPREGDRRGENAGKTTPGNARGA